MRRIRQMIADIVARDASLWRLLALSTMVGVIGGLAAIGFHMLLDGANHYFMDVLAGFRPPGPHGEHSMFAAGDGGLRRWVLLVLPALGGLAGGLLVYRIAPEAEGHGTDAAIDAYHYRAGAVRARVPLVKMLASALTIGTGGSAGREGPIAQIGAGCASTIAEWLDLSTRERRILMAAGLAAGVGAIFHAPLAGALFAAEVMYRDLDLEYEVIIPAVISSIIAYAIFNVKFGWKPLFATPEFVFDNPGQLLPYLVLAAVVAGGAVLYIRFFYGVRNLFAKLSIRAYWKPAIGGLIVGALGFLVPDDVRGGILGAGYGIIQHAFFYATEPGVGAPVVGVSLGLLLAVAAGKILTTSFSIGSGGSGGVFGPAIVIGGCLGGAVGLLIPASQFPAIGLDPGAAVIVGMAGFFAAAANTPISTIIMVSEMTGNYHLLVPSMWVCIIAYILVKRDTIYENQISSRFEAPVHRGDMMDAILNTVTVADVVMEKPAAECLSFPPDAKIHDVLDSFATSAQACVPIVDSESRLVGIIGARELRAMVHQKELDLLLMAHDMARDPVTAAMEDNLLEAVRKMTAHRLDELPVVTDSGDIRGMLSHGDIVRAYNRELVSRVMRDQSPTPPTVAPADADQPLAIPESMILMRLQPGDKRAILEQLVQPLIANNCVRDGDELLRLLEEREAQITTAIAPRVAMPHSKQAEAYGLDRSRIVLGICGEGTDFAALDGDPTHVFFLICSADKDEHLKLMAAVAGMVKETEFADALCTAASEAEVRAILDRARPST